VCVCTGVVHFGLLNRITSTVAHSIYRILPIISDSGYCGSKTINRGYGGAWRNLHFVGV
jgi:hypothetical protein